MQYPIPVVDLFAGPGGLGEGFSSIRDGKGNPAFSVKVSIEKDPVAHKTLSLRALFRAFGPGKVPDCYYDYIKGQISLDEFLKNSAITEDVRDAAREARCAELGKTPHKTVEAWIRKALEGARDWVLIGGPPCQAYSMAGRSRRRTVDPVGFENDSRHVLYTEYLQIIRDFGPTIFVMENVKGILTSKHKGSSIFVKILSDLENPGNGLRYQVRSFVVPGESPGPQDYVIEAENFGIPQSRHRVILFGVRADVVDQTPVLDSQPARFVMKPLPGGSHVGVRSALSGMPLLRSRLSKEPDSHKAWISALEQALVAMRKWHDASADRIAKTMKEACRNAQDIWEVGGRFVECPDTAGIHMSAELKTWLTDSRIGGVIQHETRRHMRSDLQRYLFASSFAKIRARTPKLPDFPVAFLPAHFNVTGDNVPFIDRFRVQIGDVPSTTVVAHIAKDGHYYIHHDPSQCRSLTVREAARLQTFPDNYFFEGSRTQQYTQIGNAVPPLLARKIADVVHDLLKEYCSLTSPVESVPSTQLVSA